MRSLQILDIYQLPRYHSKSFVGLVNENDHQQNDSSSMTTSRTEVSESEYDYEYEYEYDYDYDYSDQPSSKWSKGEMISSNVIAKVSSKLRNSEDERGNSTSSGSHFSGSRERTQQQPAVVQNKDHTQSLFTLTSPEVSTGRKFQSASSGTTTPDSKRSLHQLAHMQANASAHLKSQAGNTGASADEEDYDYGLSNMFSRSRESQFKGN